MNYKLKELILENTIVFKDRQIITFSNTDINYIEALYKSDAFQSNGAGKSLILDGISLALFGHGIRFNLLQDYITPSNLTGGIYISLELEEDSGDILKIERWRRPGSDLTKAKLWINSQHISKDSTVQKIDEQLQGLIGISHSNFLNCIFSVMLPGFLQLRPSQRFETLESVLAVRRMDSIVKKINATLKENTDILTTTNEALLEKSNLLGQETAKRDLYLSNAEELKESIAAQQKEYAGFSVKEQEILLKRNEYWTVLQNSKERLKKKEDERTNLNSKLFSFQETLAKVNVKLLTVSKALQQRDDINIECIVCKSVISKDSERSIYQHYEIEIAGLKQEQKSVNDDLAIINKEINKLTTIESKLTNAIMLLDSDLRFVQSSMLAAEKIIFNINKSLEETKKTYERSKLAKLETETKELSDRKIALTKDNKMISAWKAAMSKNGLRLQYIREEVGTLSAIASTYASAVYNAPTEVRFFISEERDTPNLDFTVNGKNAAGFSTGERRSLEIAITLSLITLLKSAGLNLNFIVLDEACDGLSPTSRVNVLNLIDSLSELNQIVMISHDDIMKNRPGNVILVTKDITTNISTISQSQRV